MNTSTIECPSCNRRIIIPFRVPFDYKNMLKDEYVPECPLGKEYHIRDILYVNDELAKENHRLREKIKVLDKK